MDSISVSADQASFNVGAIILIEKISLLTACQPIRLVST